MLVKVFTINQLKNNRDTIIMTKDKNTTAYHVRWAKPLTARKYYDDISTPQKINGDIILMHDFEILTTIASIASWKKYFGNIELYCDKESLTFFHDIGISHLWDQINTSVLERIPSDINPGIFWASAKLWVQKNISPPYTILDTDSYFINPNLDLFSRPCDLIASHIDITTSDMGHFYQKENNIEFPPRYPDISSLLPQNHTLKKVNWSDYHAVNVGCLHINNSQLHQQYVSLSLELCSILNNESAKQNLMLTAEQHLLGYLISHYNYDAVFLTDDRYKPIPFDKIYDLSIWVPENIESNSTSPNILSLLPVHIGSYRHMWLGKTVASLDSDFKNLLLASIFSDIKKYFSEYLDLNIVRLIAQRNTVAINEIEKNLEHCRKKVLNKTRT